jgi:xanthine dehydrogenase accessory factor
MTSALYDPIVLDHSRRPRHARLPPDATSVARGTNPLCGDQVDIAVTLDAHTLTDIGFEAKGCAVCIAAASVMSEAVRGLSLADVTALGERFEQRVAGAGDAASVAHELEAVASASRLPGRRDCGLLPWRTLAQALDPSPRSARPEPTPAEPDTKDALALAARWLDQGREVALATLVSAVGVGPCPPGSTLVVNESGEFFGSVSGGCVESAVVREALVVLREGGARLLDFSITGERAWEVGLPCGGSVEILVARAERAWLDALRARRSERLPTALVTRLRDARRVVVGENDEAPGLTANVRQAAAEVRDGASARALDDDGERWFIQPFHAPRRLVLVGGVHVAQGLVELAKLLEMEPVVVDPRQCFVGNARFTGVDVYEAWPDEALGALLGPRAAVVVLTHDARLDDPALAAALRSEAFYIGALGSRKTQLERRARLLALGFTEADLARIHGPVGLQIGAVGPGEIALSIAAEIVKVMRQPPARRRPRVGAVILAAGLSRRMGGGVNKLLADVGDAALARAVAQAVVESGVAPVVVVTGHDAGAIEAALAGLPVELVFNSRYLEGMGTSVAAGAGALAGRVDAAVIALGDMALLRARHVRRLVDRHDPSTAQMILVPEREGRRGNPVLWPARYLSELMELRGDKGGRALFERHASAVLAVPFEDDAAFFDVDEASDLARLNAHREPTT